MEVRVREEVLNYGLLPVNVLLPQLDSLSSLCTIHKRLAATAVRDDHGESVVPAASLAQALEISLQHCQLLLDTQAAVAPIPPSANAPPRSEAPLHGMLLFLFAQLYGREQHRPDTKDHWPDEKATPSGGPVDSLSSPTRTNRASVSPGSPNAGSSRFLLKAQLQQHVKQHSQQAKRYQEFLRKHQRALVDLVLDQPTFSYGSQQQQQTPPHGQQLHPGQQQAQAQQQGQQQQQQQQQQPVGSPLPGEQRTQQPGASTSSPAGGSSSPFGINSNIAAGGSSSPFSSALAGGNGSFSPGAAPTGSSREQAQVSAREFDRLSYLLQPVSGSSSSSGAGARSGSFGSGSPGVVAAGAVGSVPSGSPGGHAFLGSPGNAAAAIGSQSPGAASAAAAAAGAGAAGAGAAGAGAGGSSNLSSLLPQFAGQAGVHADQALALLGGCWAKADPLLNSSNSNNSTDSADAPFANGLAGIRINTARGVVSVSGGMVDERSVMGVLRGTVVRSEADCPYGEVCIQDCVECHIYLLAPLRHARIVGCTDCTIVVGAVGALLRIECCERVQLMATCARALVSSCHSCTLHLGTPQQPWLIGDNRFVTLAPYNTRYEASPGHMQRAGIPVGQPSKWDQPLAIGSRERVTGRGHLPGHLYGGLERSGSGNMERSGSGSLVPPGSPLGRTSSGSSSGSMGVAGTDRMSGGGGSGGATAGGSGGGAAGGSSGAGAHTGPAMLMAAEEFLPFVVPFRGTPGLLAGGAATPASTQWGPGAHKAAHGALPPFPFPLPPEFDAALQRKYAVVTELRSRIKASVLDEGRRAQLQGVIQAYFREWLHNSAAIRQVYDLSRLEQDEGGAPPGGSPMAGDGMAPSGSLLLGRNHSGELHQSPFH